MPEKYRLPLMLRLVERWSYEQIGQAIGLRRGGVESRLYRARKKLASLLKAGASWETHK
jgi:RNA polymerase sigma factor (sigma-70 family)